MRSSRERRALLRGTKHVWLKNEANLTDRQLARKRGLSKEHLRTARACQTREALQSAYDCPSRGDAEAELRRLTSWMMHPDVPETRTVAPAPDPSRGPHQRAWRGSTPCQPFLRACRSGSRTGVPPDLWRSDPCSVRRSPPPDCRAERCGPSPPLPMSRMVAGDLGLTSLRTAKDVSDTRAPESYSRDRGACPLASPAALPIVTATASAPRNPTSRDGAFESLISLMPLAHSTWAGSARLTWPANERGALSLTLTAAGAEPRTSPSHAQRASIPSLPRSPMPIASGEMPPTAASHSRRRASGSRQPLAVFGPRFLRRGMRSSRNPARGCWNVLIAHHRRRRRGTLRPRSRSFPDAGTVGA